MPSRPSILWIVTTQWRAQACGYAGDSNARTPGIDSLAAQGVNFAQAVTPHPFGPFARAAMLTGRPSPENGIRDYFDPLPAGARTLAHALAEGGYATAFFGKWHLSSRDPAAPLVGDGHARAPVPPQERGGFGFWEGFESGFLLNDPWLHGTRLPEPVRFEGYQADVVCERAARWLAGRREEAPKENRRPCFCVVSLESPHPPYDAPASGVLPGDPAGLVLPGNVPAGGPIEERTRRELAGYYAHVEATDRAIGRLLAGGAGDDAVVVFTSVHGDMHGAHGLFRKGWPHEESVRVPLLVRLPRAGGGRQATQGRNERPVSLIDLHHWTLSWAGCGGRPPPWHAETPGGRGHPTSDSQAPCSISMPSVVHLPHQCDRAWSGLRTPTRKLVRNADGSPWLYFDLAEDPLETRNLAADPSRAAEIAALQPAD
jgi:arylsulfatase A-like enzyme